MCERQRMVACSITLHHMPLRQGLSLDVGLWQKAPTLFSLHLRLSVVVIGMCRGAWPFCLKAYLYFTNLYECCGHVHESAGACIGPLMWVLRTELGSSARAICTLLSQLSNLNP